MELLFIVNPVSGNRIGKKFFEEQVKLQCGPDTRIVYTREPGHARTLAADAIADSLIDTVVAVGGDGTINEVATSLVNTELTLGIVPVGSGNGLARSLKIPVNLRRAIEIIRQKNTISIDVGRINGNYFFGVAGIGLDALISSRFHKLQRRGALPYFYHGLMAYFKYDFPSFILADKDKEHINEPMLITIANSTQYGNGAKIAPMADLQDGMLDVCIIRRMGFLQSVAQIPKLFRGTIESSNVYKTYRRSSFTVRSAESRDIFFHLDGEPYKAPSPLKIDLLQKALKVLV